MAETAQLWGLIHGERARLAETLGELGAAQWKSPTLCTEWTVEQVTAHLTAAASTGTWAWVGNMLLSGLNAARHNDRLLDRHLGRNPAETLDGFRAIVSAEVAPTKDYAAYLGEVIVHSQDIARPLGLELVPDPIGVEEVARFFAAKDFAVNSRTQVGGLAVRATDGDFSSGSGPLVRGRMLDLVMAMAGRADFAVELTGPGAEELRRRLA